MVHRSEVIACVAKRKQFMFPRVETFEDFIPDFLSLTTYNRKQKHYLFEKREYMNDAFHALVFCFMGSLIDMPRKVDNADQSTSYSETEDLP